MNKFSDHISIVIPGYNEEKRIYKTLTNLSLFCNSHFEKYDIIFIDDGSTDSTADIVNSISGIPLSVHSLKQNYGKGYAVKQGMLIAEGQYIFFTDADMPYDLASFLTAMETFKTIDCDMAAGARDLSESSRHLDTNRVRKLASSIFSNMVSRMTKIDTRDSQCGFKGFTSDAAKLIFNALTINGYAFDVEIFMLAKEFNLKVEKIPVSLMHQQYSKIKLLRDAVYMLVDVCKLSARQHLKIN